MIDDASDQSDLESEVTDSVHSSEKARMKQRPDYYVFAAYVPPGKHMLLLRDVGTSKFARHVTPRNQNTNFKSMPDSPKSKKQDSKHNTMHSNFS